MAINIQNLSAEEKAIQAKYIQIGNGLLPEAIAKVEELYPSIANVWEHKYLIVNEMLLIIGYDKIGAWLSKNEVMMYLRQACAYESKNNNDKEGIVKDLPYAFAHILMVRKANAELLTELYKDKMVSEAQIERIKAARDRIAVKVNVTEEGAKTVKRNASSKQIPHQRQTDPEIMAAINAASKPDTSYNINVLVSSLKKEGLNVEIADDGSAIVWTNIEDNRLDIGIVRPDNIDEDLKNLNKKCLSLGKGIDLSVVINKAANSNNEAPEQPEENQSADVQKEENDMKNEDLMTEDEVLYDKIRYLLEDNLADVEEMSGNNVVITGDTGHMTIFKNKKTIEFGRTLYARCGEIFNEEHTAEIRKALEELFGSSKAEHKTEDNHVAETVENKTVDTSDYDGLTGKATTGKKLDLSLSLIYKGKDVPVKRQIVVYDHGTDFYSGVVLNGTKKVGTFYWNVKYVKPVFKPEAAPVDMGSVNKMRYVSAIKKALEDAGIKGKQQSLFKDVPFGKTSH